MGANIAINNCSNCRKLEGAQSIDDLHQDCALCVSGYKELGFYPYWEPLSEGASNLGKLLQRKIEEKLTVNQPPVIKKDMVNSPDHYKSGGIETIDYIEAKLTREEFLGYCIGNSLKYMSRAGKKDQGKTVEDYKKAVWYINRAVTTLEKQ